MSDSDKSPPSPSRRDSDRGSGSDNFAHESVPLSGDKKKGKKKSRRTKDVSASAARNAYDDLVGDGDFDFKKKYQKDRDAQESFEERLRIQQDYQARAMGIRYRSSSEGRRQRSIHHRRTTSYGGYSPIDTRPSGALVDASVQTNTIKDKGIRTLRRDAQTAAGMMLILTPLHLMISGTSYCYQWRLFSEILTNTGRSSPTVDLLILGFQGFLFSGALVINLVVLPMALLSMTHSQLPLGQRGDSRHLLTAVLAYAIFFSIPVALCELSLILSDPFDIDVTSMNYVTLSLVSLTLAIIGAVFPLWGTYLNSMVERLQCRVGRIAKERLENRRKAYRLAAGLDEDDDDPNIPLPRAYQQGMVFTAAQKAHLEIMRTLEFSPSPERAASEDMDV